MSQKNLELVQAAFAAYYRGDEPALLDLVAVDVAIAQFPEQVDMHDYCGHEGFRQVLSDWIGSWDDWTIEILGARELGDLVLVTARQRGRGKASGVPMDTEAIFLFTVRGGLIARWQMFSTEARALESAGLAQ